MLLFLLACTAPSPDTDTDTGVLPPDASPSVLVTTDQAVETDPDHRAMYEAVAVTCDGEDATDRFEGTQIWLADVADGGALIYVWVDGCVGDELITFADSMSSGGFLSPLDPDTVCPPDPDPHPVTWSIDGAWPSLALSITDAATCDSIAFELEAIR
jgi:hypothetical protein